MSGEEKNRAVVVDHQHHQYGTFQGVANYPPPPPPPQHQHQHQHHQPAIGFPQPVPPPGLHEPSAPPPQYYPQPQGYQTVPGYAVAEGRPVRERRLPCCGIGIGWFLFIIGFFLGAIPWYIGLFILVCARIDYREKPGYIACTIAAPGIHINVHNWDSKSGQGSDYESRNLMLAILATIAIVLGVTKGAHDW